MLKMRIEGKEKDVIELIEVLKQDDKFDVLNVSNMYYDRTGVSQYSRCFVDVELTHKEKEAA